MIEQDVPSRLDKVWSFLRILIVFNRYIIVVLLAFLGIFFFRPPIKEQEAARQRLLELEAQRDRALDEVRLIERKLELLKSDAEYFDAIARDRYQMQQDGEKIIRFASP